ncbi:DUF2844 domain-containing protein [Silvimonas soli]|uniref:DUF2844 domain-containing protein n=1 Tax=Silvimonas soli TaxID=2980100 RepID=UPI0024B369DE|nr:DUF2844 domain-containing protein [Silvimonas soli]
MTTPSCGFRSLLAALLIAPCLAHAALGGAPATSPSAQKALKATSKVAASNGAADITTSTATSWTVNTLQTAGGTDIREYVTSTGVVFAVAWAGPQLPDLRALLGTYFPEFVDSNKTPHAGHTPNLVNNPDLVVQSGGKPRAYTGRAWVPSLLPADASIDQIH